MGTNNSFLWLDYIQITPPDSVGAALFSAPTSSSSSLHSPPTLSAIPPPVTASSTPKSSDLPVGVIVGATLGGLAFLAIFSVVMVLLLRVRSRHHNELAVPHQQIQSSPQFSSVNIGEQPPRYQSSADIPFAYERDHLPSSKVYPFSAPGSSNRWNEA
ncbi:hypothetical protein GALMADRAFT_225569 [Galerina marginata CBS 339.88]|uniref:Uncharacterized protein n=1 Tax=Galerina marginata (strain CBS 339.88) TaxID=685588 RepID=A0A067T9F7_GALM3|nr:hypothetical protein GALMADRAFT_225569 [Galerina marginata CBS 339.88]